MSEDVTDEELDALTARIRAHRRKKKMAMLVGGGIAFGGLVLGIAANYGLSDTGLGGRAFWIIAALFVTLGLGIFYGDFLSSGGTGL